MAQSNKSLLNVTAFMLAALLAQHAVAANIYRYIDENGRTVFNSFIPPEYVKNGYTILNERGQVIQEVPRALTADELAAQQANKAAEDQALADRVAREEADKLLIRLFRAPEEIERKRDNSLEQLKTQQDLVLLNMSKTDEEVTRLQGVIDNNAKAGRETPPETAKRLDTIKAEQATYQQQVDKLEADKAKLIADADRDVKRLRELMGLPQPDPAAAPSATEAATPAAETPAEPSANP